MRLSITLLSSLPLVFSQIQLVSDDGIQSYQSNQTGTFCASDSLTNSTFITCSEMSEGINSRHPIVCTKSQCSVRLNVTRALCYESSKTAGTAACAYDGTVYPFDQPSYKYAVTPSSSLSPIASPTIPPQVQHHWNTTNHAHNGTHPHYRPSGHHSHPTPSASHSGSHPSSPSGTQQPWKPNGDTKPQFPTSLYYPVPQPTGYVSQPSSSMPHSSAASTMKTIASDWNPQPAASSQPSGAPAALSANGARRGAGSALGVMAGIVVTAMVMV